MTLQAGENVGSGTYRVMPNSELLSGSLCMSAIQPEHIELVRQWRNAQMDELRQSHPITPEEQEKFFKENVWPDKAVDKPAQILLAIKEGRRLIGYGGLVYINWEHRRAEVSFLLSEEVEALPDQRSQVFLDFLNSIKALSFVDLGLNRLTTETFAHRTRHIETLETAGFKREGTLREHIVMNGKYANSILHAVIASD
ncbi:GNAT family N-acetyltransferase [Denitrobaculum tricleocarpae]|uniref:GNAT family N-acetyltransferase n=2 Tax=Denitrobaculum tricleocarpae TaxID=2591009 RepID=A0A545TXX9_9PROT|nr:GNAT family N-acetyltransferase [Denitrobaculum tricleocarpae]